MKIMILLIGVVFALMFMSHSVHAQSYYMDGSKLMTHWRGYSEKGDTFHSGLFTGYVLGVNDGNVNNKIPEGVTVGQLCAIVGKYSEDHPEKWNQLGWLLVAEALREAFPQ